MTIQIGQEYMKPEGGIGKLANYQDTQADTAAVGTTSVKFGQAVQVDEDVAGPLTAGGNLFGVAIAKDYVAEITAGAKTGTYKQYEALPVLRKGTIWVEVDEDVKSGQAALANTATGNFLPGTTAIETKTEKIGSFQSTAIAGDVAMLQINLP